MAQFTENRTPYEFLVRWDENGTIKGSHVGWLDTVLKDGVVLTQTPTNVEAVGVGEFPLADVLSQLQIDALKEIDSLRFAASIEAKEKQELRKTIQELISSNESLVTENTALKVEILNLKP